MLERVISFWMTAWLGNKTAKPVACSLHSCRCTSTRHHVFHLHLWLVSCRSKTVICMTLLENKKSACWWTLFKLWVYETSCCMLMQTSSFVTQLSKCEDGSIGKQLNDIQMTPSDKCRSKVCTLCCLSVVRQDDDTLPDCSTLNMNEVAREQTMNSKMLVKMWFSWTDRALILSSDHRCFPAPSTSLLTIHPFSSGPETRTLVYDIDLSGGLFPWRAFFLFFFLALSVFKVTDFPIVLKETPSISDSSRPNECNQRDIVQKHKEQH